MSKVKIVFSEVKEEKVFTVSLVPSNYLGGEQEVLIKINDIVVGAVICPNEKMQRDWPGKKARLVIFKNSVGKAGLEY